MKKIVKLADLKKLTAADKSKVKGGTRTASQERLCVSQLRRRDARPRTSGLAVASVDLRNGTRQLGRTRLNPQRADQQRFDR